MTRSWNGERGQRKDPSATGLLRGQGACPPSSVHKKGARRSRVSWRSGLKIGSVASPVTLPLDLRGEGGKATLVMSRGLRSCRPQKYLKLEFS